MQLNIPDEWIEECFNNNSKLTEAEKAMLALPEVQKKIFEDIFYNSVVWERAWSTFSDLGFCQPVDEPDEPEIQLNHVQI